jgi:heme-degrading monooxygenase HmoA
MILVRMSVPGMDETSYDEASESLAGLIRKQPGFVMHVAYPSEDGFLVGEIWETQTEFENWYHGYVEASVPKISYEVTDLHAAVRP